MRLSKCSIEISEIKLKQYYILHKHFVFSHSIFLIYQERKKKILKLVSRYFFFFFGLFAYSQTRSSAIGNRNLYLVESLLPFN